MTDLIEHMKEALEGVTDEPWVVYSEPERFIPPTLFRGHPSGKIISPLEPFSYYDLCFIAAARTLLPEAIEEIEELRGTIQGKTFTVLSDDGEAWKARAEAAEAKANVMVADKINLRSELLSVEAKLAKAVAALEQTQKHVNWMENTGSRLNRFVFDYIDDTLAEIGEKPRSTAQTNPTKEK